MAAVLSRANVSEPQIYAPQRAQLLAEALPYIRAFHGKTFVISYGGYAMAHHSIKTGFGRDVAMLQLAGMNPIVVHEGGPQLNHEIVGLINLNGGKAVGLNGHDECFIRARKLRLPPADGRKQEGINAVQAGEIERIDLEPINLLHSRGFIPVVMAVGVGSSGESYNLNPDVVASDLAEALKAEKLVLMTNAPGILDEHGALVSDLTTAEIERLFADGTIHCGWPPKLESALRALRHGVKSAHVINGRVPGALLLEVLTREGVGTMIRSGVEPHFLSDSRRYLAA